MRRAWCRERRRTSRCRFHKAVPNSLCRRWRNAHPDFVAGHESPSMTASRHRPMTGSDPRALNVTVIRYTPQGAPHNRLVWNATLSGFNTAATNFVVGKVGTSVDIQMQIGLLAESITVTASLPGSMRGTRTPRSIEASRRPRTSSTFSVAWRECCRSASTCREPGPRIIFHGRRSSTKTTHLSFHYSRR
jgi:hypothetical protein